MSRGQMILIEGPDRSGKTTQVELLKNKLTSFNRKVKVFKFPDRSTHIGKIIEEYLQNKTDISFESLHLLFVANRWENKNQIINYLNNGYFVIIDRYVYSGMVYSLVQHYYKNCSIKTKSIAEINFIDNEKFEWFYSPNKGLPIPDLTLYFDLDLNILEERVGWGNERYEFFEFQSYVNKCYMDIFKKFNDNSIQILNVTNKSKKDILKSIIEIVVDKKMDSLTNNELKFYS